MVVGYSTDLLNGDVREESCNPLALIEGVNDDSENSNIDDGGIESNRDICGETYTVCGNIMIPTDLVGTPRSMAISLYDTLSPAGPPNVIVTEINNPDVIAGEPYAIEYYPLIATGDYYVFVFLYMEGGGEWTPELGIDYVGRSDTKIAFSEDAVRFDDISLVLAE